MFSFSLPELWRQNAFKKLTMCGLVVPGCVQALKDLLHPGLLELLQCGFTASYLPLKTIQAVLLENLVWHR